MAHFSSYSSELGQMGTDQQEHEQHHPSLQTRSQSSDMNVRAFLEMNGPQSHPCPQYNNESWAVCPQPPGSVMSFLHPSYDPQLGNSGREAFEPGVSQVSRLQMAGNQVHYYVSSSNSVSSKRGSEQDNFRDWHTESLLSSPSSSFFTPSPGFDSQYSNVFENSMPQPVKICPTPSRSVSISPHQSPSQSIDSISPDATCTTALNMAGDGNSPQTSFGENSEEESIVEAPYSALIYESLKDAPERKRTLQQIYDWFKANTNKDRDPTSKGWQNSIRHNLSMNAGFEAIKGENDQSKPVNYWRLTDEAYQNGIQSTTRYRKANHRKGNGLDPATRERRRSGSKGGKAAKNAARRRNSPHYELHRDHYSQQPTLHSSCLPPQPHQHLGQGAIYSQGNGIPLYQPNSGPVPSGLPGRNSSQDHCRGHGEVISCTTPPPGNNSVFYGTGGSESSALGMGQMSYCGLFLGSNQGPSARPDNTPDLHFV